MEILKENLLGFTRFENEKFFIAECSTDFFFFLPVLRCLTYVIVSLKKFKINVRRK